MELNFASKGSQRSLISRVCAQMRRTPLIRAPFIGEFCHRRAVAEMGYEYGDPLLVFDVGANNGNSFIPLARNCPWITVYAFEPTPELVERIKIRTRGMANYHLIPKAVGEVSGTASFNVAGQGDWGCSSLMEFSDNLEETWPGRTDLKVTRKIQVEVLRLDQFVLGAGIEKIDYLHVDAQGMDLGVLRSLGLEIHRVRAGVIEVPQSSQVALYRDQHSRQEVFDFLQQQGFSVRRIISQQNEDNVHYYRS